MLSPRPCGTAGCSMSDRDQAIDLLRVAERDLRALRSMLDTQAFADQVFGFLAQQALEKSLKA